MLYTILYDLYIYIHTILYDTIYIHIYHYIYIYMYIQIHIHISHTYITYIYHIHISYTYIIYDRSVLQLSPRARVGPIGRSSGEVLHKKRRNCSEQFSLGPFKSFGCWKNRVIGFARSYFIFVVNHCFFLDKPSY